MAEVESGVLSRKTYMKKWRGLTDTEVTDELNQIAFERQILEEASFNNGMNGDNKLINPGTDDFNMMGVNSIKKDGTQNGNNSGNNFDNQQQQEQSGLSNIFQSINSNTPGGNSSTIQRLNGTQVSTLVNVMSQYGIGTLTRVQAISIIVSMGVSESFANSLLNEEDKKKNKKQVI